MLTPETLAKLTPEALAGLDAKDKQRVIEIVKDLQLTGYQRHIRDLKAAHRAMIEDCRQRKIDYWEDRRQRGMPGLAELMENARKRLDDPNRELTLGEEPAQSSNLSSNAVSAMCLAFSLISSLLCAPTTI
jgi:hypothetical protein